MLQCVAFAKANTGVIQLQASSIPVRFQLCGAFRRLVLLGAAGSFAEDLQVGFVPWCTLKV